MDNTSSQKTHIHKTTTLTTSASAEITLPSVVRDLLILAPSFNLVPLAPVESARSLPAKSTKLILLTCATMDKFLGGY